MALKFPYFDNDAKREEIISKENKNIFIKFVNAFVQFIRRIIYVLEVFSSIRKDKIQTISVPHPHQLKFVEQISVTVDAAGVVIIYQYCQYVLIFASQNCLR